MDNFKKTITSFINESQTAVIQEIMDSYCVLYSLNINSRDYKDVVAVSDKILKIGEETLINLKTRQSVSKELLSLIIAH